MKTLPVTVRGLPLGTTARQVEDNFNSSIHQDYPCVSGPVVEELQGGTCSTTVVFQKEKKGQKRDCEKLRDTFHKSKFNGLSSGIAVSDTFRGLIALAGRPDAPVHVYFVHGLGGHGFKTWANDMHHGDAGSIKAWPRDFLPKRLEKERVNARVYSLGYNANIVRNAAPNATIISAAEDLLAMLRSDRINKAPKEIYFVCHSLGGIVVCQALNMALFEDENCPNKEGYRSLFIHNDDCLLKGVVLLGTPLRGSGQANIMTPVVRIIKGLNKFSATNDSFIKSLKEDSGSLDIPQIVQRFKSIVKARNVALLIGCEQMPYIGDSLTTTYESAVSIFKDIVEPFRIQDADHSSMVKFDEENETEYQKLENLIVKMMRPLTSSQPHRASTAPATSNTSRPQSSFPRDISDTSPESTNIFTASPPLHGPGLNLNFYLANQQNSPNYSSRQYTEPFPHRFSSSTSAQRNLTSSDRPIFDAHQPSNLNQRQPTSQPGVADDNNPFNRLALFDTAFIVDDTGSMIVEARADEPTQDRWQVTMQALDHIARIAAEHDTDGIDIRFLKSELKGDNLRTAEAVNALLGQIDLYDGTHGGGTSFHERLAELIDPRVLDYESYKDDLLEYQLNFRQARHDPLKQADHLRRPRPPKPYNLIVITDGAANDKPETEEYIVNVATELDRLKAPKRQIGIQFVQVGEDKEAKKFLSHLDDDLIKRIPPIRDMVDTTPFDSHLIQQHMSFAGALEGVLHKALFGANSDEADQRANGVLHPTSEMGS